MDFSYCKPIIGRPSSQVQQNTCYIGKALYIFITVLILIVLILKDMSLTYPNEEKWWYRKNIKISEKKEILGVIKKGDNEGKSFKWINFYFKNS